MDTEPSRIQAARDRAVAAKKVLAAAAAALFATVLVGVRLSHPGDATAGKSGTSSRSDRRRLSGPELRLRPERDRPVRRKRRRRDRRHTCVLSRRAASRRWESQSKSAEQTTSPSNRSASLRRARGRLQPLPERQRALAPQPQRGDRSRGHSRLRPRRRGGARRCRADQRTGRPEPRSGDRGCRLRPDFADVPDERRRGLLTQARGGRSPSWADPLPRGGHEARPERGCQRAWPSTTRSPCSPATVTSLPAAISRPVGRGRLPPRRNRAPPRDGGIATSGSSRRSWIRGGEPQHHLIDPRPAGRHVALDRASRSPPARASPPTSPRGLRSCSPKTGRDWLDERGLARSFVAPEAVWGRESHVARA